MNNDEDDDLEVLRQAALSSLLKKKNNSSNTNALFYNPSAKPNLISIEPVKEEYYDGDNDEFSTEYVIAEGLSVSSSDVDEIVEEVIVSGDEGEENSSEGEDAVSVASKDSFDEILNSIEEEVKETKAGGKGTVPVKRRRDADSSSHPDKSTRTSSSSRNRSKSPLPKRQYVRRGGNDSRSSPLRHNSRRSPPSLHRRSPDNRRDPSTRRRSRTRSPVETRQPRTRSPLDIRPNSRSPFDDRRLRVPQSSGLGRKPRSRGNSPRKRSRSRSPIINRRQRSRSPLVRRRTRSPYRRRAMVENSRRLVRRSRSRSLDKTSSRQTSRSPGGNGDNMSPSSLGLDCRDTAEVNGDNATSSSRRSQPSSPENRRLSETSKSNRSSRSDKEASRRASTDRNRSAIDRRNNRRSGSRSQVDRDRRNYDHHRSPPHDSSSSRRRRSLSRSSTGKTKPKTRTPSPDLSNLSKEEREVFEKRKRKFQTSVNVSKLSGKIKLKSANPQNSDRRQEKTGGQTRNDTPKIKLSDKKSELSSRLGAVVVPEEESRSPENTRITVTADSGDEDSQDQGPASNSPSKEGDSSKSSVPSDESKEDLRTKLQQKRATGMGRLFSVALQDTLSTSSASDDASKKSNKRKV